MNLGHRASAGTAIDAVVFDVGRVLLDWDPRYLYRETFAGDEDAMERFLSEVVTMDWIRALDAGQPIDAAIAERSAAHPQHAGRIALFKSDWLKTIRGPVPGSVEILAELKGKGMRLYALTNFAADTWPLARERFEFLDWFNAAVVSGEIGLTKPDPRIFEAAIRDCRLDPPRTVFIDDMPANVAAASACGIRALHFTGADGLRADLEGLGVL